MSLYKLAFAITDPARLAAAQSALAACPRASVFTPVCGPSIAELEAYLGKGGPVDVLVVDTSFGEDGNDTDGIAFVQRRFPVGCSTQVVYFSGNLEHAVAVYRTQHAYFLVDPVEPRDFNDAIEHVLVNLHLATNRPLCVRSEGKIQVVLPRKIVYVESDRRRIHVHVGDDIVTTYATLDAVAQELPRSFVRCHKSFLVNMRFIESMDSAHVHLLSGDVLPISQKRRKATHEAFDAYMGNVF